MKFYEIDNALQEAIANQRFDAADKAVRLEVQIESPWGFESVFEQDILEADFYGLKEAAGGTSARGEILLENRHGAYSSTSAVHGGLMNSTAYSGNNGAYAVPHLPEKHAQYFACGYGAGTKV